MFDEIVVCVVVLIFALGWWRLTSQRQHMTNKRVVTLHYTNWCGFCKRMRPVWNQVRAQTPDVTFAEIDEDVARTPGITGYPTIVMTVNGTRRVYPGRPDAAALRAWCLA